MNRKPMLPKWMLPALAIALLGGCATSGYQYRGGTGDYYYGQPSTQYRYYNSPYGYYGSPYGYYGYPGYGYYGYYGYGSGFGYPYLPPRRHDRDHDGHHHGDGDHDGDDPPVDGGQSATSGDLRNPRPRAPWRDPGNLDGQPPDRSNPPPPSFRPQPAAPAEHSNSRRDAGSIGNRSQGDASSDRVRRRIHKP